MNSTEARLDHANGFKPKTLSARLGIIQFQIPRCAARRDTGLESWRTRPLETCAYVILGARYEKVRRSERVLDCARLIASGIRPDGKRTGQVGLSFTTRSAS